MWWHEYQDYPPDQPLRKYRVYPQQGIIGCEMEELNGWGDGESPHNPQRPPITRSSEGRKAEEKSG